MGGQTSGARGLIMTRTISWRKMNHRSIYWKIKVGVGGNMSGEIFVPQILQF